MQTRGIDFLPSAGLMPAVDKVMLMMDLVASVLHMARDEVSAVARWHAFLVDAVAIVNGTDGRVVKSLGDGLLAVFDNALVAVDVSKALHALALRQSLVRPSEPPLQLRISLHAAPVYACAFDIFGHGVNVAARLLTLARPCDTIVSRSVHARLPVVRGLEDLGDCHLKHLPEPVRAYRLREAALRASSRLDDAGLRSTVSVLPFTARSTQVEELATGALVADAITVDLMAIPQLGVMAPGLPAGDASANYVLSGSYCCVGERLLVTAEMTQTRTARLVWMDRFESSVGELLQLRGLLAKRVVQGAVQALVRAEVQHLYGNPLSRVGSSALLLGGMALMHSRTPGGFRMSQRALATLADRHGHMAAPWAWSALWHVVKDVRGWSSFPEKNKQRTLQFADRALTIEPEHPIALEVQAHALCDCPAERAQTKARLRRSLDQVAGQPLSWLSKRVWTGDRQAEHVTPQALC